jgi:hypothetical protein
MITVINVKPDMVREFSGADLLCLHPICQPIVNDAQAVIRHQRGQLDRAVEVMAYFLTVQGSKLLCTEQFAQVTAIIAEINGQDVEAVREGFIPGSAKFHRRDE